MNVSWEAWEGGCRYLASKRWEAGYLYRYVTSFRRPFPRRIAFVTWPSRGLRTASNNCRPQHAALSSMATKRHITCLSRWLGSARPKSGSQQGPSRFFYRPFGRRGWQAWALLESAVDNTSQGWVIPNWSLSWSPADLRSPLTCHRPSRTPKGIRSFLQK